LFLNTFVIINLQICLKIETKGVNRSLTKINSSYLWLIFSKKNDACCYQERHTFVFYCFIINRRLEYFRKLIHQKELIWYSKEYSRIPFRFPNYFIENLKGFRTFGNSKGYSQELKSACEVFWVLWGYLKFANLRNNRKKNLRAKQISQWI